MTPFIVTLFLLFAMAAWLLWIGRVPICECGYVKFWHGETMSSENSQHLSDWYTPSHILHGLIFYGVLWLLARRLDVGWRLAIATIVECAWEIVENSAAIIQRYREVTISLDYFGDSVVNSAADVVAMWVGFWLASRLPVRISVAIFFVFELLTLWVIRDGLTLNVIMLLYPLDAIRDWQAAG
ncbi:MAG: DUF2585 domain-containing protein [Boseongicola sp.]